jgi:hypothetical protein
MVGKKNITFGFIYLVFTAALGPYMIQTMFPDVGKAQEVKKKEVGALQQIAGSDFDDPNTMEPMSGKQIAMANAKAILALNQLANAQAPIDGMKGGPHAHGNLEAVLNIVAGLTLCFIAGPLIFKQIISWVFILGALLHSGMLYLRAFDVSWAGKLLYAGPWFVLLGLLLIGIASCLWFKGEIVRD